MGIEPRSFALGHLGLSHDGGNSIRYTNLAISCNSTFWVFNIAMENGPWK